MNLLFCNMVCTCCRRMGTKMMKTSMLMMLRCLGRGWTPSSGSPSEICVFGKTRQRYLGSIPVFSWVVLVATVEWSWLWLLSGLGCDCWVVLVVTVEWSWLWLLSGLGCDWWVVLVVTVESSFTPWTHLVHFALKSLTVFKLLFSPSNSTCTTWMRTQPTTTPRRDLCVKTPLRNWAPILKSKSEAFFCPVRILGRGFGRYCCCNVYPSIRPLQFLVPLKCPQTFATNTPYTQKHRLLTPLLQVHLQWFPSYVTTPSARLKWWCKRGSLSSGG